MRSYDSVADMTRDLALGRIKAGLGDQPIIAYQIRQHSFQGVKLAESYKPSNVGMCAWWCARVTPKHWPA